MVPANKQLLEEKIMCVIIQIGIIEGLVRLYTDRLGIDGNAKSTQLVAVITLCINIL